MQAIQVRNLLAYDSDTGIFTWLPRPASTHLGKVWNDRFAGQVAGAIKSNGYVIIGINGTRYNAHRLAWLYVHGRWPAEDIDHVNGDAGDNRLCNLREANTSQNISNSRIRSDNRSGIKGVCFDAPRNRWKAQICKDGKRKFLGRYKTKEEAEAVYAKYAAALFGEFARL